MTKQACTRTADRAYLRYYACHSSCTCTYHQIHCRAHGFVATPCQVSLLEETVRVEVDELADDCMKSFGPQALVQRSKLPGGHGLLEHIQERAEQKPQLDLPSQPQFFSFLTPRYVSHCRPAADLSTKCRRVKKPRGTWRKGGGETLTCICATCDPRLPPGTWSCRCPAGRGARC